MTGLENMLHNWNDISQKINNKTERNKDRLDIADEMYVAENLIPFPYSRQSGFVSQGVTWIYDDNGIITVNGTPTSTSYFNLHFNKELQTLVEGESYTITVTGISGTGKVTWYAANNDGVNHDIAKISNISAGETRSLTFTFSRMEGNIQDVIALYVVKESGAMSDFKIKVMLEKGEIAHSYQPYKYSRQSLEERITVLENALLEMASLMEE